MAYEPPRAEGANIRTVPTLTAECIICGEVFDYPRPPQGRRRKFCSARCKAVKQKFDKATHRARLRRERRRPATKQEAPACPDLFENAGH